MLSSRILSLGFLLLSLSVTAFGAEPIRLFDGKTFNGWEGDTTKVWRIEDGVIVGGSMEGNPQNEFLATTKRFKNFILKLEYKLVGTEGFVNGGVQLRSKRIPQPPNEMMGYQADIGAGYSGCLYDESRRKKMLQVADKELVRQIEKPGDWNRYEIRAEGDRIRLFLNGERTVDYTEIAPGIDKDGHIALQIHGGCKAVISYRNITLEPLSDNLVPDEKEVLNRFGDPAAQAGTYAPFKDGKFSMDTDEVIVLAGQTNFVREQKSGELEAILTSAFAQKKPHFRSMAWEADTVYEQWRDLNFGDWKAQLDATGASMVILQFGQMEAFDGKERLAAFKSAYHRLLDQFAARTPRIVLISPMPFEKPEASHAPDLTLRNEVVAAYADAVAEVARHRNAIYVNLFTPLSERSASQTRLTNNGIHLNEYGLRVVSQLIAGQLGVTTSDSDDLSELRKAVLVKNQEWFDCWRPANWSFVYGDRVTQMFGKPTEMSPSLQQSFEARKPLIAKLDDRIHAIARGEKVEPLKLPAVAEVMAEEAAKVTVLTPEQQMATFTPAEGYQVNLFASEDLGVAKPTQISWDEKGRLYVACSPSYPQPMPGVRPSDYILILEDTDDDGKADKSTRFAEGLTMVQGVEPGNGGVYVCDFDQIIHLKDTDGDGKADKKEVLFSGFGIGDTHQLANSITHGPDGSLWFSQGLHAFSRVETPWGIARLEKAGIWRLNTRTQRMDGFFRGGKAGHNCWGVVFDDYNQIFHKTGDRPHGYYSLPGLVRLADPDEYHPVAPLFFTNPKTTSIDIIGTKALPDSIQGCALIGGYFGNVVELHRFLDDGSGFRTELLPRVMTSTDTSFRPVDVSIGPDGAMYLADWFNPVIGHYQASYADARRDRTHGRIWRISAKGFAPVKQPNLAAMKPAELLDQLHSDERWTRYQAKRLLFDAPTSEVIKAADEWLAKLNLKSKKYEQRLLDLCGVYEAHQVVRPQLLKKLLNAKDGRVRAYGVRVVGNWADQLPEALEYLTKSIHDKMPRVRLESIVAASYVTKPEAVEVVVQALESPRDKFIDYALPQSIRALESYWKPDFLAGKLSFGGKAEQIAYVKKIATAVPVVAHPGKVVYDALCLNCHQPDGNGLPGIYPPLAESEWVRDNPESLIKILLHGLMGPIKVKGQEYGKLAPVPMPPMGLEDQQIADVLTYIRSNFGNQAPAVNVDTVKAVRAKAEGRSTFWTPQELGRGN